MSENSDISNHGPIPESYWVVKGKFLAGEYPGSLYRQEGLEKIARILSAGVTVFMDLTEEGELFPYARDLAGIHVIPLSRGPEGSSAPGDFPASSGFPRRDSRRIIHERYPIPDAGLPESPAFTARVLDAIDLHLEKGKTIYLHCLGGIGRTGTIVGCWLSRHGRPGQAALDELSRLWRGCVKSSQGIASPETLRQERYVREWRG